MLGYHGPTLKSDEKHCFSRSTFLTLSIFDKFKPIAMAAEARRDFDNPNSRKGRYGNSKGDDMQNGLTAQFHSVT